MTESIKINWYRCKVDKALMSELMRKSDARAFLQVIPQFALFVLTGTLAYLAFRHLNSLNWPTALPLLLLALFAHGTIGSFFGGIACHELCHKTPFATQFWNTFFLKIYSFLGWFDPTGYRASHIRHHQVTVHTEHDGEIMQPLGLDWHGVKFVLNVLTFSPTGLLKLLRFWVAAAFGNLRYDGFFRAQWLQRVVPESDTKSRREIRRWARVVLLGHLALATAFIVTGHWFLIVIVNFGCMYCSWFVLLCGAAQHVGLSSDVPDFRLNTRTYTCGWFPAFCYWNMQYHVEHHMFPAVPFYNLPHLHEAIKHDLPPTPHGLWATWQELLPILHRQRQDPGYRYVPPLPTNEGERATDETLLREAAQT
ncbi:MAG: fatty acid desaturase [Opitutaceae bacterium]|nr:fatty acid desaturase [Opitutaceae bacterium]MBP9913526.1 fatty acid desaturase [Opitutaceae bacterium]